MTLTGWHWLRMEPGGRYAVAWKGTTTLVLHVYRERPGGPWIVFTGSRLVGSRSSLAKAKALAVNEAQDRLRRVP